MEMGRDSGMGEPCKVSEVLAGACLVGRPAVGALLGPDTHLDKVILSCAVWPASTQMASSLSRTPPLLVRSFRRRNDSLSLPLLVGGAAHGYRYGRSCGCVDPVAGNGAACCVERLQHPPVGRRRARRCGDQHTTD